MCVCGVCVGGDGWNWGDIQCFSVSPAVLCV